jgi:Cu+-exporting ATPase
MQVDEQNAAGKSEHKGNTYYFCSTSCKTRFDQNPASFVAKAGKQQAR